MDPAIATAMKKMALLPGEDIIFHSKEKLQLLDEMEEADKTESKIINALLSDFNQAAIDRCEGKEVDLEDWLMKFARVLDTVRNRRINVKTSVKILRDRIHKEIELAEETNKSIMKIPENDNLFLRIIKVHTKLIKHIWYTRTDATEELNKAYK